MLNRLVSQAFAVWVLCGVSACSSPQSTSENLSQNFTPARIQIRAQGPIVHLSGNRFTGTSDPYRFDTLASSFTITRDSLAHGDTLVFREHTKQGQWSGSTTQLDETASTASVLLSADRSRIVWFKVVYETSGTHERNGYNSSWILSARDVPVDRTTNDSLHAGASLSSANLVSASISYSSYQALQTDRVYFSDSLIGFTSQSRIDISLAR